MRVAFRTDASRLIGTGHFMRCLTLADALRANGIETRFISRHLPDHLHSMLVGKGHQFARLDEAPNDMPIDSLAHSSWLGVSQHQDALDSINALSDKHWEWLVVDHYALDHRWESKLRVMVSKILVIDDIADRPHDCDMLLDQNWYTDMETRYVGKVPIRCKMLLGPRYALLRDEFRQLHETVRPRSGPVKRVLVFFGGIDADNYTGRVLDVLSHFGSRQLYVDVVIGANHPYREQISTISSTYGFHCHIQTNKMPELMSMADLAIGAGGGATWERCCLGLPTLVLCTAENQRIQIADAAKKGVLYAPSIVMHESALMLHLTALIENENLREHISRKSLDLVDGRGVTRILGNLVLGGIVMRRAVAEDSADLFRWRNHPSIRSVSRNSVEIQWETHQQWFTSVVNSTDRILLIGQKDELPIGVVRFDTKDNKAEVSIYLVPERVHTGQGRNLLLSAERWIIKERPDIQYIRASVLGRNKRSQQLFLGADYHVENTQFVKELHLENVK